MDSIQPIPMLKIIPETSYLHQKQGKIDLTGHGEAASRSVRDREALGSNPSAPKFLAGSFYGGCSSMAEHSTVARDVAGSTPVSHPTYFSDEEY